MLSLGILTYVIQILCNMLFCFYILRNLKYIINFKKLGLVFVEDKDATHISFTSYSVTQYYYSVCGPVIDEVIVNPLGGTASVKPTWLLLIFTLLYVAVL
ncbi:BnaC05g26180D [Brassica napus]|uniref:(rape) hypothetical protein n=1 Tax=Brassica napus TaxID=3708 RepID=A0A078G630_BRANA|nr:unnamed protein product [Brassica napus]CDY20874.1 BnaC05g26180D [Brassica napus]